MEICLLVCGGRDYDDDTEVFGTLSDLLADHTVKALVQGGASGVDRLARAWAENKRIPVLTFAADWKRFGRSAGPLRNAAMLEISRPDLVVAFPGGRGTADMVRKARAVGVRVIEVAPSQQ